MNSGKSWLCAELMRTKSGYSDWAVNPKTIWPQWSWERLGALAMYSVLSTWGQFPYTLPPSAAGNLWREFMTAYRRKRRPLTYNPVSLIGKAPYIVAMRLEQGRF